MILPYFENDQQKGEIKKVWQCKTWPWFGFELAGANLTACLVKKMPTNAIYF